MVCVRTRELISASHLDQDTCLLQLPALTDIRGLGPVYAVPPRHHDHPIGALELFCSHPAPMPTADLDVAAGVAEPSSTSICSVHTATPPDPRGRWRGSALIRC